MNKYFYFTFAIFMLTVIYLFNKQLGTVLAGLSLVILLLNRSKYFTLYLN